MKKTKLALISAIILVIIAMIGIVVIEYEKKGAPKEHMDSAVGKAEMTIKNIHYTRTHRGVKEWEIKASSGQYFKKKDLALFKDLTVTVFFKDGKHLTLNGDEGKVATDTRDVEVWGNVSVSCPDQYQFHTKSLEYDSRKREVFTHDNIFFKGYGLEVRGVGITIDIDRGRFCVLDNVSTILKDTEKIKVN